MNENMQFKRIEFVEHLSQSTDSREEKSKIFNMSK